MSESDLNKSVPRMEPPRDAWHWLRHRWARWEPYTVTVSRNADVYSGITGAVTVPLVQSVEWDESREKRRCLTCGATQDRGIAR